MTCEVERRQREKEARMEKQRLMEAQRNKAALDRALAPPYRPVGRRPVFRSVIPGLQQIKINQVLPLHQVLPDQFSCQTPGLG